MIEGITEEEHKQAVEKLAEAVSKFEDALSEAETTAEKYGLEFSIEPAYGMGVFFEGSGDNDSESTNNYGDRDFGWFASSQSC